MNLKNQIVVFGLLLLLAAGAGCSQQKHAEEPEAGIVGVYTPEVPDFICGAAGRLFTNAGGFTARLSVATAPALTTPAQPESGELLCRGPWLLYAPHREPQVGKHTPVGGFSYVWNIVANRGYIFSDALQGFAPVSTTLQVTNLIVSAAPGAGEKIGGYRCRLEETAVILGEGTNALFRVWRADELGGSPLRISSLAAAVPLTLTLSKVSLQAPPAELFEPPASFTRYPNAAALADELAVRDRNLRRKAPPLLPPAQQP